jgi:hypothetical protein
MAVFILKTGRGAGFVPPACAGVFADVACPGPFADWIEELYVEKVTGGCGADPLVYCPTAALSRGQMAVFLSKALDLEVIYPGPFALP